VEVGMTVWLIMLGLAAGTFLIRASFILVLGDHEMHPRITRALRFVPASVLSALVIPQILTRGNTLSISIANPQLIAGIVAAFVLAEERRPHDPGRYAGSLGAASAVPRPLAVARLI
jgi:branched-subunit amino acid transport protein